MSDSITTPRLVLRRFVPDDARAMHAIFADREAMRYWSRLSHTEIAETADWVARNIAAVESGQSDDFAVTQAGVLIGKAGLWQGAELGMIFAPSVWGTGVAGEAVQAVIARAWRRGIAAIDAEIDPRNQRVARFLDRLGFKKMGEAKNTVRLGDIWTDSTYLRLARDSPVSETSLPGGRGADFEKRITP